MTTALLSAGVLLNIVALQDILNILNQLTAGEMDLDMSLESSELASGRSTQTSSYHNTVVISVGCGATFSLNTDEDDVSLDS